MPQYIDNSTLQSFSNCPLKALIRYAWHLTAAEERKELLSGKAGHACLADYFGGKPYAAALLTFDEQYKTWAEGNVSHEDRLSWPNCRAILHNWMYANPIRSLPFEFVPELIEAPFEVPLDDNGDIIFIGRMDAVVNCYGTWHPLENKFTGRVTDYWAAQWGMASQGSGYCFGLRWGTVNGKSLGIEASDFMVNAIQLSKAPSDPIRKCKKHGNVPYKECGTMHPVEESQILGPYAREESMLHDWRKNALRLAREFFALKEEFPTVKDVLNAPQNGPFNSHCRFCEYQPLCLTGRRPEMLEANLVYSVWDPRRINDPTNN